MPYTDPASKSQVTLGKLTLFPLFPLSTSLLLLLSSPLNILALELRKMEHGLTNDKIRFILYFHQILFFFKKFWKRKFR